VFYRRAINNPGIPIKPNFEVNRVSLSRHIIMLWLYGMLVFLPVKIFHFPFNMELVDLWIVPAIPVFWLSIILGRQTKISMPYIFAILLILIGSTASTYAAVDPAKSLIVVLKEIYLFVWFVTVALILCGLNTEDLRRLMAVWAGVVILHGVLIISQFIWPEIWRITTGFAGQSAVYAHFRPSGLFISEKAGDANKAAFFQLSGFVPLVLARPSKRIALLLTTLLFSSILATGSMGTTSAFIAGLITSIIAISFFDINLVLIKKYLLQLVIVVSFLAGLFSIVLSQNQDYRDHFEKIIAGRAEKSSGGRFDLWQRGIDAFIDHSVFLWGVGPENFREVDPSGNDNQLHNDFLAFTVERGMVALAGLLLVAVIAISRAVHLLRKYSQLPQQSGLFIVVFLAILASMLIVSLTHQIFHAREMWLVLAFQEAIYFKTEEVV
jgi:O-antigen ligase